MPPREWTPVALLAQVTGWYHRHNGWPTVHDMVQHTGLTPETVRELLDVLVDRRFVKVDRQTIYAWEAGPSEVVTYRLSPEEIAARYGPPNRPAAKPQTTEEAENMPKGVYIAWPPAAELVAMANEIQERGGNVLGELAERFACSTFTVRKQLQLARRAILQAAPEEAGGAVEATAQGEPGSANAPSTAQADEEADETMAHVDWPDPQTLVRMADELAAEGRTAAAVIAVRLGIHPGTVRKKLQEARRLVAAMTKGEAVSPDAPDPGEAPSPGELMQEAEEEASRLVAASVGQPDARSVDPGISDHPREETAVSEAHTTPAPEELATFRQMLLVDPGALTTRWERDHVTRAPEKEGDHWAQPVRERGFLRWREWVCVAVLADGTCLMVPPKAVAPEETEQRRTA
ncbi:hypothetical protein [Symbiobacterium terraclitae]|uniref:hypothetical protein n=1 Tax=Symbiobacterium terraclitae TaxID=557451 RepID=UPI0035B52E7D